MQDAATPAVTPDAGLDAAQWLRHRWARLAVAIGAIPVAFLVPTDRRTVLVVAVFVVYLPVALVVGRLASPPRALGALWWVVLLADCLGLGALLAALPEAEAVLYLGFLLVVVVNGVAFGLRAGMIASAAAIVSAVAADFAHGERALADLVVDGSGFALVAALVAYVVGRQAVDLRRQSERLERALADLKRVDELRSRLVSTLAHDVRGPLGGIQGALETVLQRRGLDADVQVELLEGAVRQTARILRLSNGLLDLARLEEGRLELDVRSVPLKDAVDRALSSVDPEGRVDVTIDPGLCVAADAERLDQIVVNLISNTLRHGAPPFVVAAARTDGWVDIAVRDAGRGVPEDRVGSLFAPFRRGDTAGSVGLGLSIVKMLTEAHGGQARYEPNAPTGACFHVTLPAAG